MRELVMVAVVAGCGGPAPRPETVEQVAPDQPGEVRWVDEAAPLRDCPDRALEAMIATWKDPEAPPRLDACLRGRLGGDGERVIVYASVRTDHDYSDVHRAIVDLDGRVVQEVTGIYVGSQPPPRDQLVALVDLDGDGTDEVLERLYAVDEGSIEIVIGHLAGGELAYTYAFIESGTDPEECLATWTITEPDARGRRTMVVEVTVNVYQDVEFEDGDGGNCHDLGTHTVRWVDGAAELD